MRSMRGSLIGLSSAWAIPVYEIHIRGSRYQLFQH